MNRCSLGAAVFDGDLYQNIARFCLRILDEDVEVAVGIKETTVNEFELRLSDAPSTVLLQQATVRVLTLWILIEHLQVGMRRRGVEVVVELFDILTVIPFSVGQTEQPLLKDRVAPVPQCQCKAQPLLAIRKSCDAVFPPAIRATARMIVREVLPRIAVRTVVFADRAPLSLRQVRAPGLPSLTVG